MSDTETTFTEDQSHAISAGDRLRENGKPAAKKDNKKTTSASVTEADEARELAEMRKGGFIMGKKGVSSSVTCWALCVYSQPGCRPCAPLIRHHGPQQT